MKARRGPLAAWGAVCALMAGCAGTPPSVSPSIPAAPDPVIEPIVAMPAGPSAYELQQRERAASLTRQGRLADAALVWEVLATIRPAEADYRERLAELRARIASGVADRLQRGDQAMARGQIDNAMQQFLAALALDPDNDRAADALRAAERERVKRQHLGKLSRHTLTRRAMSEAEVGGDAPPLDATAMRGSDAAPVGTPPSAEVDQATRLAAQGQWDAAITLLEQRLKADRRDAAARTLLADVYFRKADGLAESNRMGAVALLEQSLRHNPRHPQAAQRLRQLRASAPSAAAPGGTAATTAPTPGRAPAAAAAPAAVKPTAASLPAAPASASPRR